MSWSTGRADSWSNPDAKNSISIETHALALERLKQRTGLSEMELASAFIPVLAVEQGFDPRSACLASIRCRVFKRSDFAARFRVYADRPIGLQLANRGLISFRDAELMDGALYDAQEMALFIRVNSPLDTVEQTLNKLSAKGLIDETSEKEQKDGKSFIKLKTKTFVDLARHLSIELHDNVVLLSLNGAILFV